jgi:cytochrome c biogenesis protein
MKLALTLLFVIAIVCIIGTVLPQGDTVAQTDWVNNPLYDFYKTLGLFDMYNSWWFQGILILLISNLTVCVTKRTPTAVRHLIRPRTDVKDIFITSQPTSTTLTGAGPEVYEKARKLLRGHHFRVHEGKTGVLLAEKGRFSPLASIAFHLSFLFIGVGAVVGGLFGFEVDMEIPDGKTATVPEHPGIQVKNNKFDVEYNEIKEDGRVTGYRPAVYSSDLEIFKDGESVAQKTITVNSPLRYEGLNFHQASYYQTNRGYVTVLGVNQTPGKSLIYTGFIMMMGAITFALYIPHRRIWLKQGKKGDLLIGGRTNRSKVTFSREFDNMVTELRLIQRKEAGADELG